MQSFSRRGIPKTHLLYLSMRFMFCTSNGEILLLFFYFFFRFEFETTRGSTPVFRIDDKTFTDISIENSKNLHTIEIVACK